jgi:hypothetical protein
MEVLMKNRADLFGFVLHNSTQTLNLLAAIAPKHDVFDLSEIAEAHTMAIGKGDSFATHPHHYFS